jgi:hypothetical protein
MGKVTAGFSMSLDGFIAAPDDRVPHIFDWSQQCLDLGLDEIRVELAPVILGSGIPFFADLKTTPVLLDDPTVIEGDRVTHLVYTVRK